MIDVYSRLPEFGYELLSAVPYAKWLYNNGQLGKTVSGNDTKALYWWSKDHTELNETRGWHNQGKAVHEKLPNINIHTPNYNFSRWASPEWFEHYRNDIFVYGKPILCICNRVNVEWEKAVINYFDLPVLDELFKLLKKDYQIIYFNIQGRTELYDGVNPQDIGDYEFIHKNHQDILIVHDILQKHDYSFNMLQLMLFANSRAFITMNGGYGIIASYFPGTNIIYSNRCNEVRPKVHSFWRWYPKLGGQRIVVVRNYESLLDKCKVHFIDKVPAFNVATRTSNRSKEIKENTESVMNQTYPNVNHIVSIDDDESNAYTIESYCLVEKVEKLVRENLADFPFNLYFNQLKKYFYPGYVIHLDNDDTLCENNALSKIAECMESTKSDMVCFRVEFPEIQIAPNSKIIPSDRNFGKYPVIRDFSGSGFAVRTEKWQDWKRRKQGDWELATRLFDSCKVAWLPDIFVKVRT